MKALQLALIAAVFAVCYAKAMPWYYKAKAEGFFDESGYFHHNQKETEMAAAKTSKKTFQQVAASQTVQDGQNLCTSSSYFSPRMTTFLHVCPERDANEYCFITNGQCCNFIGGTEKYTPKASFKIDAGSIKGVVDYYPAAGQTNCYNVKISSGVLNYCTDCVPQPCTIEPICDGNTVPGTCDDDSCKCQVGWAPPSCCECDFKNDNGEGFFYETIEGDCKRICRPKCDSTPTIDGCSVCQEGYKAPDCCKCDKDFYKHPDDGTCRRPCTSNIESCTDGECQCKPGFKKPDCCKCDDGYYKSGNECKEPKCPHNHIECKNGDCTCKRGYLPNDCCECAPGFYKDNMDEKCKDPCTEGVFRCINNVCVCEEGYTGQGCCECKPGYEKAPDGKTCIVKRCEGGIESCSGTSCVCKPGYTGNGCCDCAPGFKKNSKDECVCIDGHYYDPKTETCKKPECESNLASCKDGVCTCKPGGYLEPDCCIKVCTGDQDISLVIDTTNTFSAKEFCELHYGTLQLVSALKPGFSKTDLSAVLYPSRTGGAYPLVGFDNGCEQAVGLLASLIDRFLNKDFIPNEKQPYENNVRVGITRPGPAIDLLRELIEKKGSDRRQVVVILTDGVNDEDPAQELKTFREKIGEDTYILAVGYSKELNNDQAKLKEFREGLEKMAGNSDNVVIDDEPTELMKSLVNKMVEIGAMCKTDGDEVIKSLGNENSVNQYCQCVEDRDPNWVSECTKICTTPDKCRNPPKCPGQNHEFNKWYIGSPGYVEPSSTKSLQRENQRELLEQEILAAVEEVLQQRHLQH